MKKILIATSNPGKINEIQHYLQEFDLKLLSQAEFNIEEVEETGLTFIENAIIKARHASKLTGLAALADDSGLVIDALKGAPGIYSARYAGQKNNSLANIEKVLDDMRNIPEENRSAYFYCAIALMRSAEDPAPIISVAAWHGSILLAPKGEKGFGYDPCFYVPTHHCSAAELDLAEKNKISHRGLALQKLKQALHEFT